MGTFKRLLSQLLRSDAPGPGRSSFDQLGREQFEAHVAVDRYGSFQLTAAVRPSFDLQVVPRQGYRHTECRPDPRLHGIPMLLGAASGEHLFEILMDLLDPLGKVVDACVISSHGAEGVRIGHREQIDLPVLKSILWDFEDLLENDGCTGIAVFNPTRQQEVQLDEHKLLIVYGDRLRPYEEALEAHGVLACEQLQFINQAEHLHVSNGGYRLEADRLVAALGIDRGLGD